MKVAFLTPEYPPGPAGGIGIATQQLARGLVTAGHEAWVVSLGTEGRFDDHQVHVQVHDIAHPRGLGWFVVRRDLGRAVRDLVRTAGVELLVAPDWLGLSAGVRTGCPVLVSCNGSATYFADLLGEPVRRSVRAAERLALRGADSVSAVSRFTAERTQALFGLADTPRVLYNGVDLARFPDPDAPPEPGLIVHLGTLVRKKGVIDLAEAFSTVVADRPSTRLVVAGRDRPDARTGAPSTWAMAASRLSADARAQVDQIGPVDQSEIPGLLARADLAVFPSHAEANPVSWIEAMAAGRPIVGYAHGWATEVVEDGVTGWLVPPGDTEALAATVIEAMSDPDRRRAFGRRARRSTEERFSTGAVTAGALEWFQQVLDRAAQTGPAHR